MNHQARGVSAVEVTAVITRADGTVQNLGTVSATYTWRKPVKRLLWPVRRRIANRRIAQANRPGGS